VLARRDNVRLAVRAKMILSAEKAKRSQVRRSHPYLESRAARSKALASRGKKQARRQSGHAAATARVASSACPEDGTPPHPGVARAQPLTTHMALAALAAASPYSKALMLTEEGAARAEHALDAAGTPEPRSKRMDAATRRARQQAAGRGRLSADQGLHAYEDAWESGAAHAAGLAVW
jgi:hypothetical protein